MVENTNLQEVFNELEKETLNPELIQDNKLHFSFKDSMYRVHMPNQKQYAEAMDKKHKKHMQLLQEKDINNNPVYLLEKNLISVLKETQNIDITKLTEEINDLEKLMLDKYLSMAKLTDADIKSIEKLKDEIEEIRSKRMKVVLERADYLSGSIQNQAQDEYMKYLTSVCTELLVNTDGIQEWKKVWENYKIYEEDFSNLTYIAIGRLTELMLNV